MTNKLLLLISLVLILSCTGENEVPLQEKNPGATVKSAVIKKDSIAVPVMSVGTLSSESQTNLSFLTGGIIAGIHINEGEKVKKGKLLASLDLTEILSRLKQASLGKEKAERDFKRVENLYRDTVATLEQYQNAKTALDLAETNYQIALFNKNNSEIRAPANGKILKKLKEANEIVSPGHPVLVFASTESDWVLKTNLSDRDIVRTSRGDNAEIRFDAYPGRVFPAVVSKVAEAANLLSGTYEVELKLQELPERLVTGLIGQATIYPPGEVFFILPAGALTDAEGRKGTIFLIKDEKSYKKEIDIAGITDEGILVKEGLEEGDRVITDGNVWIRDKEEILVND